MAGAVEINTGVGALVLSKADWRIRLREMQRRLIPLEE